MPADKEREVDRRPHMYGCRFRVLVPICLGDGEMLQVILEARVACAERELGERFEIRDPEAHVHTVCTLDHRALVRCC
jgi:hypothetical protein